MKKIVLVVVCLATLTYGAFHFIMPEKAIPRLNQFFSQPIKEVQLIQDWLKYRQQQQLLLVDVIQPVSPKQTSMLNTSNNELNLINKIFNVLSLVTIEARHLKKFSNLKFMLCSNGIVSIKAILWMLLNSNNAF